MIPYLDLLNKQKKTVSTGCEFLCAFFCSFSTSMEVIFLEHIGCGFSDFRLGPVCVTQLLPESRHIFTQVSKLNPNLFDICLSNVKFNMC